MLFDPEIRKSKYTALREDVCAHGFCAEVMVGEAEPDALAIWVASVTPGPSKIEGRFWVACRSRGWFLGVSGPRRYCVTNPDDVSAVAIHLAKALRGGEGAGAIDTVVRKFQLSLVDPSVWHREEVEEHRLAWEQYGWFALGRDEESKAWKRFGDCVMRPDGELSPPTPNVIWAIRSPSTDSGDASRTVEGPLTLAVFDGLRECTQKTGYVLVLDWDHACYRFLPHQGVRKVFRDYWAVPVWPRDDSYYFLAPDFTYGLLASRSGKIYIFGQALIDAVRRPSGIPEKGKGA